MSDHLQKLSDGELQARYVAFLEEAHTAPKSGFGLFTQNATFAPANKALEVYEELIRRKVPLR